MLPHQGLKRYRDDCIEAFQDSLLCSGLALRKFVVVSAMGAYDYGSECL